MLLTQKVSAKPTHDVFNFQVPNPASTSGSPSKPVTLAKTMIEPTGVITSGPKPCTEKIAGGVETGAEISAEATPCAEISAETLPRGAEVSPELPLGYLVKIGPEQTIEMGPGSLVEVSAESFAEAAPSNVETSTGTMVEVQPGSLVELISQSIEVVSGQLVEVRPGSEVNVLPFTTFEAGPESFKVSIVPGSAVTVEGGFLVAATGSSAELVTGSNVEEVGGCIVKVGPEQMVELMPGAHVELQAGSNVKAGIHVEVPANYIQVEAGPSTFVTAELGSEIEIIPLGGTETSIEVMPGSEVEAEYYTPLEVISASLEQVNNEFVLEVVPGSAVHAETGSQVEDQAGYMWVTAEGGETLADDRNNVHLWSGTMVTTTAWWQKLTPTTVNGTTPIAYNTGVTSVGPGFFQSIEASGLDGASIKLSAAFSSSLGQNISIQLTPKADGTITHGESYLCNVWQLVVGFTNDSGQSLVQSIAPSQVPFLLVS